MTPQTNNSESILDEKCYHQSVIQYDEFEDESTGEICYADYEICKECNAVIFNDKIIGYDKQSGD